MYRVEVEPEMLKLARVPMPFARSLVEGPVRTRLLFAALAAHPGARWETTTMVGAGLDIEPGDRIGGSLTLARGDAAAFATFYDAALERHEEALRRVASVQAAPLPPGERRGHGATTRGYPPESAGSGCDAGMAASGKAG